MMGSGRLGVLIIAMGSAEIIQVSWDTVLLLWILQETFR